MTKHAIIGSRSYPQLEAVKDRVLELHERHGKDWILVSGGAEGVCQMAEQTHLALGGPVLSFRPARRSDFQGEAVWGAEEWRLIPGGQSVLILDHTIEWADFKGAAFWRSMLIAERADHGDAFWDGRSRGTSAEIDLFVGAQTPLKVFHPQDIGSEA